jgi:hypothetical protein
MPQDPSRHKRASSAIAGAIALAAMLVAPAAAQAGIAVSSAPNLPNGGGTSVTVGQSAVPGQVLITQTFSGPDSGATGRVTLIRLAPACGPGPSVGNPSNNGPAINTPEAPCSNPDIGVFGLGAQGTGAQACTGISFAISAPDSQGHVTLAPSSQVTLQNGQVCEIDFPFAVLRSPSQDTFPFASGMHTTSVSAVRTEVIANPGNPAGVGLLAAGIGSGAAVLVTPADCTTTPNAPGCVPKSGKVGENASSPKLQVEGTCVRKRIKASVSGSGISKVTYLLNGRVLKTVKGPSPFELDVTARKLSAGPNKLTAKIAFQSSSQQTEKVSKKLARCRAPNFTG